MNKRSEDDWLERRAAVLGMGTTSTRKTYYPALRKRLSDLQHAEEELRASYDRLESLIEALPDWIWETNADCSLTYCSPQVESLLGYRPEEVLGKQFADLLAPEEPAATREALADRVGSCRPFSGFRAAYAHREGGRVILETSGVPIIDEDGVWRGCRGIHRDVTASVRASERLRRTQYAVDRMNDAAFWIGPDGRFIEVNEAACRGLGYTKDELLRLRVSDVEAVVPAESWEGFWSDLKRQGRQVFESRHRRKDGSEFPVEVSVNYVESAGEEYHFAVVRDLTARKAAEAELAGARAMLQAAIEQSPAGILIADPPDGRIRLANSAAVQIRGAPTDSLVGIPIGDYVRCWQAFYPDGTPYDPRQLPLARALLDGETVRDEELVVHHVDGSDRRLLCNAGPVLGPDGEVLGGVVVFSDITEHRRLQQQLSQSQKMEAVGRLAGGVAHDLNNLLSPVLGYSELMLAELEEGDSSRGAADEIHAAALRARDLVRQLLAFGRRQPLVVKPVDLNHVLSGFHPFLRRTIREDVRIELLLAEGPLSFEADGRQIEQVLLNLALNAQDAMPAGGTLTMETGWRDLNERAARVHGEVAPGRYVTLAISDTGDGMDERTRERIFDPFFTTKELGHGTGLGLATVYGIVKQHGGHIWVESEPGRGSRFECCFPVSEAAAGEDAGEVEVTPPARGQETILVAEDNAMVRKLAVGILERKGYNVIPASDGTECLEKLQAHDGPVDLLLTDVIMPDTNGRQLYEQVSSARPGIRVLYMSGYTEDVIVHHGVLEQECAFLQKPFTIQTLTDKVRAVLDT